MVKASEIVGRPVVLREGGRDAGRIRDLVVDAPGKRVLGFVIAEGLFRTTRVAPWAGLLVIGPDSVILAGLSSVVRPVDVPAIKEVLDGGNRIRGLRLQTTAGKDLGRIEDLLVNDQTGEVEGYELSGGVLSDTIGGHSFLPTPLSIELGKDVAFVAPEVEATIRQHSGGIRGVFGRSEP
ncbi:MAG: PRC-barrel domain-containing protein [Actinobacteria bacterium]|nr:PRC-barrel domain-containing protein [Actinomycetota bacterium]